MIEAKTNLKSVSYEFGTGRIVATIARWFEQDGAVVGNPEEHLVPIDPPRPEDVAEDGEKIQAFAKPAADVLRDANEHLVKDGFPALSDEDMERIAAFEDPSRVGEIVAEAFSGVASRASESEAAGKIMVADAINQRDEIAAERDALKKTLSQSEVTLGQLEARLSRIAQVATAKDSSMS